MSWNFVKREWGAITFVLTVLIGLVVVPIALYLESQGPAPVAAATATPSSTASAATTARPATPTRSP